MDLSDLTRLYEHDGPFVSVYLNTESAVEDAAARLELRWKDIVRELADAGVDQATIDALSEARGPHDLGGTRVLIASQGTVHLARSLPEGTDTTVVTVRPLPYLLPLVDWTTTRVPHVVVLTDRQGADVLAYTEGPEPAESTVVDSARYPYHKTGIGGWSAKKFEFRVQENWKLSAREVATQVVRVAQDVSARVVIAAGDVYAVQGLGEHLPHPWSERYVVVDGGRAQDGSDALVADRVLGVLGDVMRRETESMLADFVQYRGRKEEAAVSASPGGAPAEALNAADGMAEVVEALRRAQVGTLLLSEDLDEDRPLWFGPDPTVLGLTADDVTALGVDTAQQGAAVDVLLRAALGTGADVRLVPGGAGDGAGGARPSEGVGALLRYATRG